MLFRSTIQTQAGSDLKPGYILLDQLSNTPLGVLVHKLSPDKYIVFHFEKDHSLVPIFSKINYNPNINKSGTINQVAHRKLKSALLKYYRTHNLSPVETKSMGPLMDFAFPNGIPEYSPESWEQDHLEEVKLNVGKKIFLNTTASSSLSHLNNSTATVVEINPNGMWVVLPPENTPSFIHKCPIGYSGI